MNGNEVYGYDVVMARAGRSFQRNLLDPTGRLHGVQPWQFYAPDFARGPATSTYGGVRTIDRPNLGLSVRLEVVRSVVETAPATHSAPAQPRLTALTVRVVARTEPVGPYRTASPAP
jgi:hypothetical protein